MPLRVARCALLYPLPYLSPHASSPLPVNEWATNKRIALLCACNLSPEHVHPLRLCAFAFKRCSRPPRTPHASACQGAAAGCQIMSAGLRLPLLRPYFFSKMRVSGLKAAHENQR